MSAKSSDECSVWCKPNEGLHTGLDYGNKDTYWPVGTVIEADEDVCVPKGAHVEVVEARKATEAPPCDDPEFPYAYLVTTRLISVPTGCLQPVDK
jgi:hypothetical protein